MTLRSPIFLIILLQINLCNITTTRSQRTSEPTKTTMLSLLRKMGLLRSDTADATAAPSNTTKSEVYLPSDMPPYETPLDLRFPLHFDPQAHGRSFWHVRECRVVECIDEWLASPQVYPPEQDIEVCGEYRPTWEKPDRTSLHTVEQARWNARDDLLPLDIDLHLGRASRTWHCAGPSPIYFKVELFEGHKPGYWREVHETVMQTIKKHFEQFEQLRSIPVRYVIGEGEDDEF